MFEKLLVLLAVLAVAMAGTWVMDSDTQATTAVGCGAGSATQGIAGAAENGVGPIIDLFDGSAWTKKRGAVDAGLLMDAAISADGKTQFVASMGAMFLSTNSGNTYESVPGFLGISQDVHVTKDVISAVGSFMVTDGDGARPAHASGVAFSTDGGSHWNVAQCLDEQNPRYGAFPTASTWYVSAGIWNTTQAEYSVKTKSADSHRHSHRVNIGDGEHRNVKIMGGLKESITGWYGAIYKTTDGGVSFTKQFTSPDDAMWYFNEISCSDESNCIAVAEGYNSDMTAPYAGVYQTIDGGATWKAGWESSEYSAIMACKMISSTEGWFAASPDQRAISTDFYHTTDGGATWTVAQTLDGCMAMDMDMQDTLGVVTCMNGSGSAMVAGHYEQ